MTRKALFFLFFFCCAASAWAQDNQVSIARHFSGEWYSFEPSFGTSKPCGIKLSADLVHNGMFSVLSTNCQGNLGSVSGWHIHDGQIRLIDLASGRIILSMGGNQFRMTGTFHGTDTGVIFERAHGGPDTHSMAKAISEHGCLFRGYTTVCASGPETARPDRIDTSGAIPLKLIVNLRARAQPRTDAQVLGVLKEGTRVVADQCLATSDGLWCRAKFGDSVAWISRNVLRDDTWPVISWLPASENKEPDSG